MHKKKSSLTIINQYFFPTESAAGVLLRELAEDLSTDFDVTVVCQPEAQQGEERALHAEYHIVRLPAPRWISRATTPSSFVLRWIVAGLFLLRSSLWLIFSKKQSLVLIASEPPFVDTVLGVVCWMSRQPYALLIQDLYPELAEAVRLKPICFASRPLKWLHTRVTRAARVVVTISPDQQRALESRHAKVTQVLPNWAPISSTDACELAAAPGEFPLERTRLIVHYAGNLGLACDLTTLGGALEILQHSGQLDSFSIVIRGEGIKVHQAQDLAHRYPQVQLHKRLPLNQVGLSMGYCHAHFVLMPKELLGCVYPSKVISIMAYGRPMITCMPAGSWLEHFMLERQLGYVSRAGDPQSLAAAMLACLHDLRASPQILRDMGLNGWRYARYEWTRQHASARYRDLLKVAIGDVN